MSSPMSEKNYHFGIHKNLYANGPVVHALITYNTQPEVVEVIEENRRRLGAVGAKFVKGRWAHTTIVAMPGIDKDGGLAVAELIRPTVGALPAQKAIIKPPEDKVDGLISDVILERKRDLPLVYNSIVSAARQIKPDFQPYVDKFDPHVTWAYRVEDSNFTTNPPGLEIATTIGSIAFTWQWPDEERCQYEWDELARVHFNGGEPN